MSDLIPPVGPEQLDALIQAMERVQALESEIARLKEAIRRLADQDATLSVCDGNVTVAMDGTLTDEEREAVERLCEAVVEYAADDRKTNGETFAAGDERAVAIVRGWLARLTCERQRSAARPQHRLVMPRAMKAGEVL